MSVFTANWKHDEKCGGRKVRLSLLKIYGYYLRARKRTRVLSIRYTKKYSYRLSITAFNSLLMFGSYSIADREMLNQGTQFRSNL